MRVWIHQRLPKGSRTKLRGRVAWVRRAPPAHRTLPLGGGIQFISLDGSEYPPPLGTAVAVGVAVGLGTWIAGMVFAIASDPPDMEALKNKFIPQKTIDMTKETIEWARRRMPLSRGS